PAVRRRGARQVHGLHGLPRPAGRPTAGRGGSPYPATRGPYRPTGPPPPPEARRPDHPHPSGPVPRQPPVGSRRSPRAVFVSSADPVGAASHYPRPPHQGDLFLLGVASMIAPDTAAQAAFLSVFHRVERHA